MAFSATCDRCGAELLGRELRYHLTMEVAQAYDPLEIASQDQRRDMRSELESAIKRMETLPAEEVKRLEDEVFSSFRFDLCPRCAALLRDEARAYLKSNSLHAEEQ